MAPKKQPSLIIKTVPIQRTDLSTFDDSFAFLKEKFQAEMQRMDDEMGKFNRTLKSLYGVAESPAAAAGTAVTALSGPASTSAWESLADSPLIQGEGDDKTLNLQFDLSYFHPPDIKVEIAKDILTVRARHEETSDNGLMIKEFKRELLLPLGVDPNSVISSLSRDGVLTVTTPLPALGPPPVQETSNPPNQPNPITTVTNTNRRKQSFNDPRIAPGAPPGALVPQTPLSTTSPASPESLPRSETSQVVAAPPHTPKKHPAVAKPAK